ncbi:hypothetical protein [Pedobacter aquatilis]|uniref:hypothetical protein n=1 Tax=Pedobacter aquatilis TaxID=351343 RepID=UPI0029302629|nr:hypothetical protein [Pedobacter aquatilis]
MRNSIILFLLIFTGVNAKGQSAKDYKFGHYYTKKGDKISGFLYCSSNLNSLVYKQDSETPQQTINLDDVQSVVLASSNDSLVVKTQDNKSGKKYLATQVASTPEMNFFCKYTVYTTAGSQSMSMSAAPTMAASSGRGIYTNTNSFSSASGVTGVDEAYFYEAGDTTYELTKKNYIDILSKAFADNPVLIKQLQSKYLGFNDLGLIFKKYNENKKSASSKS